MDLPRTQYAKSDGVNVAYQVVGNGPFDLVLVPGSVSHIELRWRVSTWARSDLRFEGARRHFAQGRAG